MNRLLWILLLAALSQRAFAQPTIAPASDSSSEMAILLRNGWSTLDMATSYDFSSYFILANMYESLVAFDGQPRRFRPWLSLEVPGHGNHLLSADSRTYRFPLRKGVKFHEGGEMTPEDVRYSFLREIVIQQNGRPPSYLTRPLFGIDSATDADGHWALDPKDVERAVRVEGNSIVFELRRPFPGFLRVIATLPVVVSKSWAIAHGGWDGTLPKKGAAQPVEKADYLKTHDDGTGPFFVADAKPHVKAVLKRFPGYWGASAHLSTVVFRAEPADAIRASELLDGNADYVYLDRPSLPFVRGSPNVAVIDGLPSYASGETIFFTFDVDPDSNPRLGSGKLDGQGIPRDFFKDKDVRLGFAHAFNREIYFKMALDGKGSPASGPIPPALLQDADHQRAQAPAFDLRAAEASLRKAYGGKLWDSGFVLTLAYPRGNVRRQVAAQILKDGLESLNPKFKIRLQSIVDYEYTREYLKHRLPLFIGEMICDYPDPHPLAFSFLHSKGYFAAAQRFSDPELDAMEEKAAEELEPRKRAEQFVALERRAADDVPQIYTYYPVQFKAVRSWLQGQDQDQSVNGLSFAGMLYLAPLKRP